MATPNVNVCMFTGHLVADPDTFSYGDGKTGCHFRLAVNGFNDKVAWLRFSAFNGLAEKVIVPIARKGMLVTVVARAETTTRDDRGAQRTEVGFVVTEFQLPPRGAGDRSQSNGPAPAQSAPASQPEPEPVPADDGVPF